MQIRQYNVRHTDIIVIKDVIAVAEKGRENKKLLAMENTNKTAIAKVAKVLSAINFGNKHSWAINNADIDVAKNLRLIGIKKYWRHAS